MYCQLRRVAMARGSIGTTRLDDRGALRPASTDPVEASSPRSGRDHGCDITQTSAAGDDGAQTLALLESAAIALGAADLSEESIRLARLADHQLRTSHDTSRAARLARLFHHTLLGACPNRHMLTMIDLEALGMRTPPTALGDLDEDEAGRVADDHEAILDMIAAGAPRGVLERSLRRHTSESALCSLSLRPA